MMMKVLDAGGIPPLTDGQRAADADNPEGYFEFERVKQLPKGDTAWLPAAQGKAVKVIAALVPHLPLEYTYRIIFMRRSMPEILASQRQMLNRRGEDSKAIDDETLARLYDKHILQVEKWMRQWPNVIHVNVNYNETLKDPDSVVAQINQFLGGRLDLIRSLQAIDPALHRQRAPA